MFGWILLFLISCILIVISGKWVIDALLRVSRFLSWKEFVVAFFSISLGAVIPELFIGVSSALKGVSELSFGNIVGQNIILFSLAPALCAIILKNLEMESRTVRAGSTFAVIAAILPLFLILNGTLSRFDGVILILAFFFYISWFFSKKERFTKVYEKDEKEKENVKGFLGFLKDVLIIFGGLLLIVFAAQGIVSSSQTFSTIFNIPLPLVGILIVGMGTALPETFLALNLAKKGQSWMILGGLMGAVAVSSTLVLGIVALIQPVEVSDFSPFAVARLFLVASALFFLFFVRTQRKITFKEALFLLGIYIAFLTVEILTKQ